MWSDFTITNIKFINKFNIKNEGLINYIYKIRDDILNRSNNFNFLISKVNISKTKINQLKNSVWVDPNLNYDYLDYEVKIKLNNSNIFIKTTKDKFNKIKKRLFIFLKIINYINNKNEIFNLYLILTNKKKTLSDDIISPKNINSGYTKINTNEIFIWREEEFEKVTFHEMIHLCNKDHRDEDIILPIKINGPESYYEAITDFKAIIYNLIYISIITNKKLKSLFKLEIFFIYNQAKYINNYLNIYKKNGIIEQNSPAYSYYILKYLIFCYFINKDFDKNLFENIFIKNINYNKLIKIINNFQLNENDFINFNSCRMTLFELE